MMSRLYLETTIPIYPTSRPSRNPIIAGHQQVTKEWWEKRRDAFQLYISQLVVDEASAGDPIAAREKAEGAAGSSTAGHHVWGCRIGVQYSRVRHNPHKAATDVARIAIAVLHGMDFLVTWNC